MEAKEGLLMRRWASNKERLRKLEMLAAAEAELDMKFEIPRRIKKMSYEDNM